ncbi:hypothetical protein P692DRAFT_20830092 [Suillus brevipes Sb2]|nr:hypothetical protein P692DRAFT_20830092 [Suillus brevipes Sb2]
MRFAFAIAVVAALISATDAVSNGCPSVCFLDSQCRTCSVTGTCRTSSHAPNIPERLIVEFEVEECIDECRK